MSSEIKLLSCPFCGGEANPSSYHPKLGDIEYGVSCAYCGCERIGYSSRENANAVWNTRAALAQPSGDAVKALDDLVRADGRDESDFSHGYYTALDEAKYRIAEKLNEMGVE